MLRNTSLMTLECYILIFPILILAFIPMVVFFKEALNAILMGDIGAIAFSTFYIFAIISMITVCNVFANYIDNDIQSLKSKYWTLKISIVVIGILLSFSPFILRLFDFVSMANGAYLFSSGIPVVIPGLHSIFLLAIANIGEHN